MMGWAACSGGLEPGAWLLAAMLFTWQFPHFMALSWKFKPGYSRAGYRMASVENPEMCKRAALRHSFFLCGLSVLPPFIGMTGTIGTVAWLPLATVVNGYMTVKAWKFYKNANSSTSNSLFMSSIYHLPVLMLLFILCCGIDDWLMSIKSKLTKETAATRTLKELN